MVSSDIPVMVPPTQSCQLGARSPAKNGRMVSPWLSGGICAARDIISLRSRFWERLLNHAIMLPPLLRAPPTTCVSRSIRYRNSDGGSGREASSSPAIRIAPLVPMVSAMRSLPIAPAPMLAAAPSPMAGNQAGLAPVIWKSWWSVAGSIGVDRSMISGRDSTPIPK